jgi:sortase A
MSRLRRIDNWRDGLVLCLLLVGLQQLAGAGMIKAKAWLAPVLIEQAWQDTLTAGHVGVRPWPWADTWPVARLRAPEQGVDLLVLAGDSGNALAFGPGHASASVAPGGPGLAVIGGHRDTHFAFLQALELGDTLQLQLPGGKLRQYHVDGRRVVNAQRESLSADKGQETLMLVTCYPLDALRPGGPLRYVVTAVPVSGQPVVTERGGSKGRTFDL